MCVGGNLPTLGLLYGLVTATFLHSAASEQHIPQREGGRKKKRVSIERGRTGNEESVKKGGGGVCICLRAVDVSVEKEG